jgi:hypothetical protein
MVLSILTPLRIGSCCDSFCQIMVCGRGCEQFQQRCDREGSRADSYLFVQQKCEKITGSSSTPPEDSLSSQRQGKDYRPAPCGTSHQFAPVGKNVRAPVGLSLERRIQDVYGSDTVGPARLSYSRSLVKWVALWAPIPWPKGFKTVSELDSSAAPCQSSLRTTCASYGASDRFTR